MVDQFHFTLIFCRCSASFKDIFEIFIFLSFWSSSNFHHLNWSSVSIEKCAKKINEMIFFLNFEAKRGESQYKKVSMLSGVHSTFYTRSTSISIKLFGLEQTIFIPYTKWWFLARWNFGSHFIESNSPTFSINFRSCFARKCYF